MIRSQDESSMFRTYGHAVNDILANYNDYYDAFCVADTFSGPSVYFHNKALSLSGDKDTERFLETIYAVLVSWGMHRMGPKGAKMVHFREFYKSVSSVWSEIETARKLKLHSMKEREWHLIRKVYDNIRIMKGKTHIVGKSKVMAHLFPDIIAPVDRQYTLQYLQGSKRIKTDYQWELMKSILEQFYYKIAADSGFQNFADELIIKNHGMGWDTSRLKLIDNLVIGAVKKDII